MSIRRVISAFDTRALSCMISRISASIPSMIRESYQTRNYRQDVQIMRRQCRLDALCEPAEHEDHYAAIGRHQPLPCESHPANLRGRFAR